MANKILCPHCGSSTTPGMSTLSNYYNEYSGDLLFFKCENCGNDVDENSGEIEWNDGYFLEGLDRCGTIQMVIENLLVGHPSILRLEDGAERVEIIQEMIQEIYQDIGEMSCDEEI